jgi:hypothetical protein
MPRELWHPRGGQIAPKEPRITAQHVEQFADSLVHFSGSVRIETDRVVITADEADSRPSSPAAPIEFDVRGNVHVLINK